MLGLACLVFVALTSGVAWGELQLRRRSQTAAGQAWAEHLLLPLLRVFCLMAFIAVAHPALFGRQGLPAFGTLLADAPGRFNRLINLLFLAGLLLPAIPLFRRLPGLILPLQGCLGVALLFSWFAPEQAGLWPGLPALLLLSVLSGLAMATSVLLSQVVEDEVLRQDLRDLLLVCLQLPVLVAYGHVLGQQLQ